AISPLHGDIIFHDAFGHGGMRPKLDAVGAIEGTTHGVVEMIVREHRAQGRSLSRLLVAVHLETCAARRAEAFKEQAAVFTDEKPTITDGGEPFGGVGDGGEKTVTDFSEGSEAGVGDGSLRDAWVVGDGLGESGDGKRFGEGVKCAEAVSIREELPASK